MRAIALASNDRAALNAWQQCIGSLQNVRLSGRQGKNVCLNMYSPVQSVFSPKLFWYTLTSVRTYFRASAFLLRSLE